MTPDDPRHGTRRGYNAGCDCDDCKRAHSMYCKTYRLRRARSGGESVTVPTTAVLAHIADLEKSMTRTSIARAAGVHSGHISRIMLAQTKRISRDLERRLLAVRPDAPVGGHWVTARGAKRRLQSLYALGYSIDRLGELANYGKRNTILVIHGERTWITSDVDQRIRRLWDELCMTPPSTETRFDRGGVTRAKRNAARLGYLPPLAWDNIDLDDEPAKVTEHKRNTLDEYRHLTGLGESHKSALRRLGISQSGYDQAVRRAGRAA